MGVRAVMGRLRNIPPTHSITDREQITADIFCELFSVGVPFLNLGRKPPEREEKFSRDSVSISGSYSGSELLRLRRTIWRKPRNPPPLPQSSRRPPPRTHQLNHHQTGGIPNET